MFDWGYFNKSIKIRCILTNDISNDITNDTFDDPPNQLNGGIINGN